MAFGPIAAIDVLDDHASPAAAPLVRSRVLSWW
jgi:hypothetical protein